MQAMTDLQRKIFDLAYRRRSTADLTATVVEAIGDKHHSTSIKAEILNMVTLGMLEMDDTWKVKAKA